jgi:hypothetical protein
MWGWIQQLDRLLRGEVTSLPELRTGRLNIPVFGLSFIIIVLGMIYGVCMGLFAVVDRPAGPEPMQIVASMIKVPALFFLTLLVTFPSLYVFNALVGSQLRFLAVLRLLIGAMGITLAVLASLGPIIAFFSISTTNYSFILLLNVVVYAASGFLGLGFLLQTLHRITLAQAPVREAPPPLPQRSDPDAPLNAQITDPNDPRFTGAPFEKPGPLDRVSEHVLGPHVKTIFRIWIIVFGLVGAQMAWVLRPFVGQPDKPFEWFRHGRESNFFQGVWHILQNAMGW